MNLSLPASLYLLFSSVGSLLLTLRIVYLRLPCSFIKVGPHTVGLHTSDNTNYSTHSAIVILIK